MLKYPIESSADDGTSPFIRRLTSTSTSEPYEEYKIPPAPPISEIKDFKDPIKQEIVNPVLIVPNKKERVNHPNHYKEGGIEAIDVINAFKHIRNSFALGNAVKYILRAGKKEESTYVEDLKKAVWYLQSEIDYEERSKP